MSVCLRCAREHPAGQADCQAVPTEPRQRLLATRIDTPAPEGEDTLAIGTEVGLWTITRFLKAGGMGAVYEAISGTGTRVAVKVLRCKPASAAEPGTAFEQARQRFRAEAEATYHLRKHRNVVEILSYGELPPPDRRPYLVMEFLQGCTLDERLRKNPPRGQELRRLLSEACDGLAAIHEAKIVHRDLKPENMWVVGAQDGETSIRLLDFGISKMPDARKLTATGVAIGTPHYMAPEQLAAQKPDPRSDIYAFGVILYQMFSGHLPFCSDDLQALIKQIVIDAPPPLIPGNGYAISRKLDRLIRDCLAKELDARPQSALDLKDRLLAALDEPAALQTALAIATMTAPRRRVYWALAGSLVLALAAGIFAVWGRSGGEDKAPRAATTETATPTRVAASPAAPDHRPAPLAAAPAAAGALADTGARAARKNPRQARAALPPPAARSASAFHPAGSALQPGPPPATPPLPPVVPGARGLPPLSPTTPSPSAPARVAAPEVEAPRPSRQLTPSERDLITDKDTLFR